MRCPNCDKRVSSSARFCPKCGTKIEHIDKKIEKSIRKENCEDITDAEISNIVNYSKLLLPNFILDCVCGGAIIVTLIILFIALGAQAVVGIPTFIFSGIFFLTGITAMILQIIMAVKLHRIKSIQKRKIQFLTHLLCPIIAVSSYVLIEIIVVIITFCVRNMSTGLLIFMQTLSFLFCFIFIGLLIWNATISFISKKQLKKIV